LLCVQRESDMITSFAGAQPVHGDRMIYVGKQRVSWQHILAGTVDG
jgi:hypothetical protein